MTNIIWEMKILDWDAVHNFDRLAQLGVDHFKNLFKAQRESYIIEILQITQLFPRFVKDDDNEDLMAEVSEG